MNVSTTYVSPLRQHMRKFESKTQAAHLRAVRKLAALLDRSPDTLSAVSLCRLQMDLMGVEGTTGS